MKRWTIVIGVVVLFMAAGFMVQAVAKSPDTFVLADIGTVASLDPAKCYDNAGSGKIWTICETFGGAHRCGQHK